jgi:serine/threonine protein kinase
MEYCEKGDLSKLIAEFQQKRYHSEIAICPEDVIWSIFSQVALALHFCHTGGMGPPLFSDNETMTATQLKGIVIHRDIKPENSASALTSD